jgi:VanZ family protein
MFQKLIIVAAWASIVALAYATLTHVGFVYSIYYKLAPLLMRPGMRFYAHFEHVIAFALLGALFSFAYPGRLIFVCSIICISAVALEYLQTLTPDRHGTLIDAFEKVVGGALGIFAAHAILWFTQSRRRFQN